MAPLPITKPFRLRSPARSEVPIVRGRRITPHGWTPQTPVEQSLVTLSGASSSVAFERKISKLYLSLPSP